MSVDGRGVAARWDDFDTKLVLWYPVTAICVGAGVVQPRAAPRALFVVADREQDRE